MDLPSSELQMYRGSDALTLPRALKHLPDPTLACSSPLFPVLTVQAHFKVLPVLAGVEVQGDHCQVQVKCLLIKSLLRKGWD